MLDEPTSGLDPLMQEEFLAFVAEERDRGATVFLSSHELDEVERVCDRVGIIREGRLVGGRATSPTSPAALTATSRSSSPSRSTRSEFGSIPGVTDLERDGNRLDLQGLRRSRPRRSRPPRATP